MRLPRIRASRARRRLLGRLVANGLAQAGVTLAAAVALHALTRGAGPPAAAGVALLAAAAALVALRIRERVDAERLGQHYARRVRTRLFRAAVAAGGRGDPRWRIGPSLVRLVTDLNALRHWVGSGVARLAVAGISLAGALGALAWLDPGLALAGALLVAGFAAAAALLTGPLRRAIRAQRGRRGRLASRLGDRLLGVASVASHGRLAEERAALDRAGRRLASASVRRTRVSALLRALPEAALPLGAALGAVLLASDARATELPAGLFVFGVMATSLRDVARAWSVRLAFEEGRRRVEALLEAAPAEERAGVERRALPGREPLRLDAGAATLRPGETAILVGPSGSGKSTLLLSCAGLGALAPVPVPVRIDGAAADGIAGASLRAAAKLVSPELPLLPGRVLDNVRYGGADASERVAEALEVCGLGTLRERSVAELPAGLLARVRLARAWAAAPRLLLVDDPYLLGDPEGRKGLARLAATRRATLLIAAGEPPELAAPHAVWRIEAGAVAETGASWESDPGWVGLRRKASPQGSLG